MFIREQRNVHREAFDFLGFATLSLGVGALQLMLDRGELKDWFSSTRSGSRRRLPVSAFMFSRSIR